LPIYEYQCRACGEVADVRHGFDEKNSEVCPKCGGELARRFSPAGIVFKGSGFYVTDSRKAAQPQTSASKSSSPSGDGAKADGATSDATKSDAPTKSDAGSASSSTSSPPSASKGDTAAA
jgi:putative FmdB family regulatory protein